MESTKLADVKAEIEIPADSKFLGYVVHVPSTDEFLIQTTKKGGASLRAFAQGPALAQRYSNYEDAVRNARASRKPAEVGLLFDTGPQYFYASQSGPLK